MQENKSKQGEIKASNTDFVRYVLVSIIFAISFFYVGDIYRSRNIRIKYISQGEILTLEKERVSSLSIKDRQLFFGKPEQAIKYIEQIQTEMSQKGTIILLADSKIYGNNVSSISKEVHQQIIDRLGEGRR